MNTNGLKCISTLQWHFVWSLETNELVLLTIDGIGRARPDRFLGKNNGGSDEWNAHLRHSDIPPIAFKSRLHLSIRPIVWRGSRQQWQRALPPVFITTDFPDGEKSFCTCSRNRCGGKGAGEREREKREKGERGQNGSCETKEKEIEHEHASVWSFINRRRRSDYLFSVRSL